MSNLFIGRMSIRVDENDDRYDKKYYDAGDVAQVQTNNKDWLNGLSINDYVLISINFKEIVKGKNKNKPRDAKGYKAKICLWKVLSIIGDKTTFESILDDIDISLHKIASLKIIKITEATTNLAMKSSSIHAFWKLDLVENITLNADRIAQISTKNYYSDLDNFRKIILLDNKSGLDHNSDNIQMFKEDSGIKLYPASFINQSIIDKFKDQTQYLKINDIARRKQKDIDLKKISIGQIHLTIPQLYDTMFTEYNLKSKNKTTNEAPTSKSDNLDKKKQKEDEQCDILNSKNQIPIRKQRTLPEYQVIHHLQLGVFYNQSAT